MNTTQRADLEVRARSGDARAFGEVIAACDEDLRGLVWSIVRSATDTDDVMQASYEKAFRSIESFHGDSAMKTWLHSICYRTALNHVRFEKRRRHESTGVLETGDLLTHAATDSTSDAAVSRSELASVLEQLTPDVRALLMLTAGLGYTFDETAEITSLERGTVASRVGRAKKKLRDLNPTARDER